MKVFGTIGDDLTDLDWTQIGETQILKQASKRFHEAFDSVLPQNGLKVTIQRRSDYYQVNVFLREKGLLPEAEQLAGEVENELQRSNLHALIYVKEMTA